MYASVWVIKTRTRNESEIGWDPQGAPSTDLDIYG
jgi:hypothetical protein